MPENEGHKTKALDQGGRRGRRDNGSPSREAEILRLAYELREGGIAEGGLGFALTTLGAGTVALAIADGEPFGRGARLRAARSEDRDRRAAWTILSACGIRAVQRRLQAAGVASNARPRTADRGRDRRPGDGAGLRLVGGAASFGEGASRTPMQEQLGSVAEALFGEARAA